MKQHIAEAIQQATLERIRNHEEHAKFVHDENVRRVRRGTGAPDLLEVQRPSLWDLDTGFNPYKVRSRRFRIAHAISSQLRDGSYSPFRPAGFSVPKPSGNFRTVSTFQIADEVVSNRLLRSLLRKNGSKFSGRAYAYRSDRGPHDAIDFISTEFAREHRIFIAEYDFSDFFDSIDHSYLFSTLDQLRINRTQLEENLIKRFLESPKPYMNALEKNSPTESRKVGLPQGTSISLFLANLAAAQLDRSLEKIGVDFVRYADDTLIWSRDYSRIQDAVSAMQDAADRIGTQINYAKSPGVRILTKDGQESAEMNSTNSVTFLGHSIALRSLTMNERSLSRIKNRVNALIYNNLLREPMNGTQDASRLVGTVDKDYITFLWQLRRYLYGSLTEKQVRSFQHGNIPPMSFRGAMAFFPLVDESPTLTDLDTWIETQVWLALRKRSRLLQAASFPTPSPMRLSREDLRKYVAKSRRTGESIDLRIPSPSRMAIAIRRAVNLHGLGVAGNHPDLYLYENGPHLQKRSF